MENTLNYAKAQDEKDPLKAFRNEFIFPKDSKGTQQLYFCGNSLGLQPKRLSQYLNQELEDWANLGVEGHFEARNPWMHYHEFLAKPMAKIVGAKPEEVVIMNTLTVNLHLMMVSFYQPTTTKFKIVIESDAFPSDKYAVESQLKFHGFDPAEALIQWRPRQGEELCRYEDFETIMEEHGDSIALVMIGNTNYYTGQAFPLKKIAALGHKHDCMVGFDLAHGVGNIQPNLSETGADFAVWCTYKYLNSGPGSIAGCFVNERHHHDKDLNRFAGWWGHNKDTRFNMRKDFDPTSSAEGWQLSNSPVLSMAGIKASLSVFDEAGFENVRAKSVKLTNYLEFLLKQIDTDRIRIITPSNPEERGCQLSVQVKNADKSLHTALGKAGVICDWREPDVIRLAPAPIYNSFEDVFRLVGVLKGLL